jgi:hypothetical protein
VGEKKMGDNRCIEEAEVENLLSFPTPPPVKRVRSDKEQTPGRGGGGNISQTSQM